MSEQTFDFRGIVRALARRRRIVLAIVAVGLAAGALFSVLQQPVFKATARVLLPPSAGLDSDGRPLREIETEIHVARSAAIIEAARRRAGFRVGGEELRRRTKVRARSVDLLEITVEAPSSGNAAVLANAVAAEYVAYANNASSAQVDATVLELQRHARDLERQISELNDKIAAANARTPAVAPGTPGAVQVAALLTPLLEQQLDAEARLYSVTTRIGDLRLGAQLSRGGTRVLEEARAPAGPATPRTAWNTGFGALGGLVAGVFLALHRDQHDRRLRHARDIVETVRAPVLASLSVPRRASVKVCRNLLEHWEPSQTESLALRDAFALLGVRYDTLPGSVTIITLAGDQQALLLTAKLAGFTAVGGVRTALVVRAMDEGSAALRLACEDEPGAAPPRDMLSAVSLNGKDSSEELDKADLIVTVDSFGGEPLSFPTWRRPPVVVLAVSSGFATPELLASAAISSLNQGYRLRGIFIANPDPGDSSGGEFEPQWAGSESNAIHPGGRRVERPTSSPTVRPPEG